MCATFDRNFFTQVGLDSGSLTMLGVIVHSFEEPGEYRGVVLSGEHDEATFYVSVDRNCAVASVNIDLAALAGEGAGRAHEGPDCGCGQEHSVGGPGARYVVHPKGYAVFRVSAGAGGYAVIVRKAEEDPDIHAYDSRTLKRGDIFSAILMRPGRYSVRNALSNAGAEVAVAYPRVGKTGYKPPPAEVIELKEAIEPPRIELQPMQGLNFHVHADARIVIELEEADDGPRAGEAPAD